MVGAKSFLVLLENPALLFCSLNNDLAALCGGIADSRIPNATLASLTMELNCAAEAWLTFFASVDEGLLVDGLGLSTS